MGDRKVEKRGKKARKQSKSTEKYSKYADGKAIGKTCPKCGPCVFMAEHKDRRHCGRCGYMEKK